MQISFEHEVLVLGSIQHKHVLPLDGTCPEKVRRIQTHT